MLMKINVLMLGAKESGFGVRCWVQVRKRGGYIKLPASCLLAPPALIASCLYQHESRSGREGS